MADYNPKELAKLRKQALKDAEKIKSLKAEEAKFEKEIATIKSSSSQKGLAAAEKKLDIVKESRKEAEKEFEVTKKDKDVQEQALATKKASRSEEAKLSNLRNKALPHTKAILKSDKERWDVSKRAVAITKASNDITSQEYTTISGILDIEKMLLKYTDAKSLASYDEAEAQKMILAAKEELALSTAEIKGLEEDIARLTKESGGVITDEIKDLQKVKAQKEKARDIAEEILDSNIGLNATISEQASAIKINNMLYDKFLGVLNLSQDALKGMLATMRQMIVAVKANPWLLVAAAGVGALMVAKDLFEMQKMISKEMNMTFSEAEKVSGEFWKMKFSVEGVLDRLMGVNVEEGMKSFIDATGNMSILEGDAIKLSRTTAQIATGFGTTSDKVATVAKQLSDVTGETMQSSLYMTAFIADLAQIEGAGADKVLGDIADNTEAFAAYAMDGGKNIMEAAVAARKLGSNLGIVTKIADSLLDFETSIEKEMEASMLIGKQLNYNKARELALEGDLAGAAQDVVAQIGGKAELQKMNVIQRRALAESIGVSVDELSRLAGGKLELSNKGQEKLAKSGAQMKLEGMDALVSEMSALKSATIASSIAMAGLAAVIGVAAFKAWQKGLIPGMKGPKGKGKSKGKAARTGKTKSGKPDMRTKKGQDMAKKASDKEAKRKKFEQDKAKRQERRAEKKRQAQEAKSKRQKTRINKQAAAKKRLGKFFGMGAKKGAKKAAGKSILKKIPGVGLIAGLGFAASRLMKGDGVGALGELASGALSMVPVIGTAASVAVDATLMARDVAKSNKDISDEAASSVKEMADQTPDITPDPKDASRVPDNSTPTVSDTLGDIDELGEYKEPIHQPKDQELRDQLSKEWSEVNFDQQQAFMEALSVSNETYRELLEWMKTNLPEEMAKQTDATLRQQLKETLDWAELLTSIANNTNRTVTEIQNIVD